MMRFSGTWKGYWDNNRCSSELISVSGFSLDQNNFLATKTCSWEERRHEEGRLFVNIFVNVVCVAVLSKETETCCEFLPDKDPWTVKWYVHSIDARLTPHWCWGQLKKMKHPCVVLLGTAKLFLIFITDDFTKLKILAISWTKNQSN